MDCEKRTTAQEDEPQVREVDDGALAAPDYARQHRQTRESPLVVFHRQAIRCVVDRFGRGLGSRDLRKLAHLRGDIGQVPGKPRTSESHRRGAGGCNLVDIETLSHDVAEYHGELEVEGCTYVPAYDLPAGNVDITPLHVERVDKVALEAKKLLGKVLLCFGACVAMCEARAARLLDPDGIDIRVRSTPAPVVVPAEQKSQGGLQTMMHMMACETCTMWRRPRNIVMHECSV
ncbi:hypothetical protein QBC46DRAFT_412090 [Diplogelasinospora grovesii]|uniref:Uncharacterized protein n=1 Tax=Diplogelasinospora grovesii TaxID=303347 RepID=A0AAN6N282_9PEZI|nr:hypothetical protein QBC46DRAFT_412090 [Diplogelasinospora grovesii]